MPPILEAIVQQHAMEASLLWPLRDAATALPSYDLDRLGRLDGRVEAHLDGLRIAGDPGWEICKAALDDEAGQVFAVGVLAVERGDLEEIAHILDIGGAIPGLARAIVSALGWAPAPRVSDILPGLLDPACPPSLHYLGIAACAAHRLDPGDALARAIAGDDEHLVRRSIKAAGELGRTDLIPQIRERVRASSGPVRFAAARASTLLGDRSSVGVLREIAGAGGPSAAAALSLAVRCTDPATAAGWIHELAGRPETSRAAVAAAGALGDAALVPWLLSTMEAVPLARLAGEAFTFITGIEIEGALAAEAPAGFEEGPSEAPDDDDVAVPPDAHLEWPAVAAVGASFRERSADLAPNVRRLVGEPIAPPHLRQVLRNGRQRRRAAAALELALLSPAEGLFEVRAPAFRQKRALGS